METMSPEALLACDKFNVDEGNHHIEIDEAKCETCSSRPCLFVCPAKCYTADEQGRVSFDYAGCLECGTCRISCRQLGEGGVVKWEYPRGTFGVTYRLG